MFISDFGQVSEPNCIGGKQ